MTETANACVICVDSSDFMLNGDYYPTRWGAQLQAVTWLLQELASSNTCTVVGIKSGRPTVLGSTSGSSGIRATLNPPLPTSPFSCGCSFKNPYANLPSLQLAQLLLRNRRGGRVILFSGSPTSDSTQLVGGIVANYKENNIAFDVVTFGDADNDVWEAMDHCRLSVCPFDGPSIEDNISLLRWDAHQEEPPPPTTLTQSNIPLMRIPPPSRVCRRVVVDSTKVPAHSLSLSLSLMLSLSLPSLSGSPPRDRVVLMVSLPPQRNKKILVEFRAGRCQVAGHEVRPLRKKGHLAVLQVHDNLLQFVWRDRATSQIALDVSVHSGEATFQRVPLHTTSARVYYLHIFDTNRKHFFWMQHPDATQDDAHCAVIHDFLAGPPPPHQYRHTHLDPTEIQHLLSLYRSSSLPSPSSPPSSSSSSSSSPSSFSSSSASSFLSSSESSRKWITNPAWNPRTRHSASLTELPLPPRRAITQAAASPVRVPTSARVRAVCAADESDMDLVSQSVRVPSSARVRAAVCAGADERGMDLTQTLASPASGTTSPIQELGLAPTPATPIITPPSTMTDPSSAPLDGAPPPPPTDQ
eukprot:Phypoly_transcript_05147.p1 GENE.Phypoly_transcript_05147~~Phypoly_transcript_05147.p1  ORF type:complete len:581 (+),score=150.69 Phypoly_transcript_05147:112-1854(+)